MVGGDRRDEFVAKPMPVPAAGSSGAACPSLNSVIVRVCGIVVRPDGSPIPSAAMLPKNNIVLSPGNGSVPKPALSANREK